MRVIEFIYKNKTVLIISIFVIILLLTVYITTSRKDIINISKSSEELIKKIEQEEDKSDYILIYVTGEVENPKIVEVKKGVIINDVIKLCGGFTSNASNNINLVYEIDKNVTLIIKGKENASGLEIIEDGGDIIIVEEENGIIGDKVNINTATYDDLIILPGVGDSTASAIISFRKSNGNFKKIQDIMLVPGIKEAKYNLIKRIDNNPLTLTPI